MKLYISLDIEGITGVTSWSETDNNNKDYAPFVKHMEKELVTVCEAAKEIGFDEILVNDGHETGRNITGFDLPEYVKIIRGWSGNPLTMIEGIDESFDAIAFVGYHAPTGSGASPLSHTMHVSKLNGIRINGKIVSEFLIGYYSGLYYDIPTVFLSGDAGICSEVNTANKNIGTVATKEGFGGATINKHSSVVLKELDETVSNIDVQNLDKYMEKLPDSFYVEVDYRNPAIAYRNSFYPNANLKSYTTVEFEADDFFEVLRFFAFVL